MDFPKIFTYIEGGASKIYRMYMDEYGNNCCLLGIFCSSELGILLTNVESLVLSCTSSEQKSNILETCLLHQKM